jgi:uncharacterized membrane protein YgdD (TMEM256/DUF423 family)
MTRLPLVLAAVAALIGAAGVALAAAGEHSGGGDLVRTASLFLVLHAVAGIGVSAHARMPGVVSALRLTIVGLALQAGAALFAADLAMRAFAGERLFPFAAPIGGSLMIVAWAALAATFAAVAMRSKA